MGMMCVFFRTFICICVFVCTPPPPIDTDDVRMVRMCRYTCVCDTWCHASSAPPLPLQPPEDSKDAFEQWFAAMEKSQGGSYDLGARPAFYPGATSGTESAWRYAVEAERVSVTLSGLFRVGLRTGVVRADAFGDEIFRLFSSTYAEGFGVHALMQCHNDVVACVRAFADVAGHDWERLCWRVFSAQRADVEAGLRIPRRYLLSFSGSPS